MPRDHFSNFSFTQEILPQDDIDADTNGAGVNRQGYNTLTFIFNIGRMSLMSDASYYALALDHTEASALGLGPSDYTPVASIDLIRVTSHIVTSGIFQRLSSASTLGSQTYKVGYVGSAQYVRARIEKVLTPSYLQAGVIAMRGEPSDWPVTYPSNKD
jgi:hypothetical protein